MERDETRGSRAMEAAEPQDGQEVGRQEVGR
jgi:hypothetical protein